MSKKRRFKARYLEEFAYVLDSFRLPGLRKQQGRAVRGLLRKAKKLSGKKYKRVVGRGLIEEI